VNPPRRPLSERAEALRIAIQDRQRLYLEGMALVLAGEPDLEAAATAAIAAELVAGPAFCGDVDAAAPSAAW
jgi:hypothetical protein